MWVLTKTIPHTFIRNGYYYFSRRVPSDLRDHYSYHRIVQGLRTTSPQKAKVQASITSAKVEAYWNQVRLAKSDVIGMSLVRDISISSLKVDTKQPQSDCPSLLDGLTIHGKTALISVHPEERCVAQGQKKLRRMAVGSAVTTVLAVIIAVLTLAPMPSGGPAESDKIYHVLVFACLAFPLPLVRPRWTVWVILGVIAYGGVIEVIQPFFGRQAEWADLVADGIGAAVGAVTGSALSRYVMTSPRYRGS
jgi:VanZ family protein